MSSSTHSDCSILKTELLTVKTLLESALMSNSTVQNRDLITIDTKIGIINSHLITNCCIADPDLTLLLSMATQFSKYLQDPQIANSYYNSLKLRLPTTFSDVKTLYLNALLALFNKPTIKNICNNCHPPPPSKSPLEINIGIH